MFLAKILDSFIVTGIAIAAARMIAAIIYRISLVVIWIIC